MELPDLNQLHCPVVWEDCLPLMEQSRRQLGVQACHPQRPPLLLLRYRLLSPRPDLSPLHKPAGLRPMELHQQLTWVSRRTQIYFLLSLKTLRVFSPRRLLLHIQIRTDR